MRLDKHFITFSHQNKFNKTGARMLGFIYQRNKTYFEMAFLPCKAQDFGGVVISVITKYVNCLWVINLIHGFISFRDVMLYDKGNFIIM